MLPADPSDAFAPVIALFTAAARARIATRLAALANDFDADEIRIAQAAADLALLHNARIKLNRVLLLELHASERAGELTAADGEGRFAQFLELACRPAFADHLDRRYPPLRPRLERALAQQCDAVEAMLARIVADRPALAALLGRPAGRLRAIALGQGDLHEGGQTVARVSFDNGDAMYKPHSLRIDAALDAFLARVFGDGADRVRVPAVIDRDDYGWAAFAAHRYCEGDAELATFYRGLGHWLAVLRLLGGTDIHLENLIAVGPVPMVIDVESLFDLTEEATPSGCGDAHDAALKLIRNSVLRTGIVPFRTSALGFEGVDTSAAGALPDQQPRVRAPTIVDAGTPQARLQVVEVDMLVAQNHPSPKPQVSLYWDRISDGFLEATATLRALDRDGALDALLAAFVGCRVREVRRTTRAYVELGRMLWHPASLHDEPAAIERARDLLARNASAFLNAPSDPAAILGEIDDMRYGDVPVFAATLTRGRIDAVIADWRAMRLDLEDLTIRSALVATDLNQRIRDRDEERSGRRYAARRPHAERLDARRRTAATAAVSQLLRLAVYGDDGSTTWITPEISRSGWLVQPLRPDLYFGLGGVAVALAGYLRETAAGRADAVEGVARALDGALQVMRALEAREAPDTVGAFSGFAAQVWTWLTLHDLSGDADHLSKAVAHAEALARQGFGGDTCYDLIDGAAGAIVPLLALADATGDPRWRTLAAAAGRHVESGAISDGSGACWPDIAGRAPANGFAHGATGVAWALARLALAGAGDDADRVRWRALSDAAFAFQESFFDPARGDWRDARDQDDAQDAFHTWCHGSVGIGLAASDLYARTRSARHLLTMRRAVASARGKWGSSHTLCHGDMSLHELFARAAALDPFGCAIDPDESARQIVSAIEEHRGMVGGLTRAAFTPGLMTGLAGAVHGLNRLHPDCRLPSPLLLERVAPTPLARVAVPVAAPARNVPSVAGA